MGVGGGGHYDAGNDFYLIKNTLLCVYLDRSGCLLKGNSTIFSISEFLRYAIAIKNDKIENFSSQASSSQGSSLF